MITAPPMCKVAQTQRITIWRQSAYTSLIKNFSLHPLWFGKVLEHA